MSVGECLHEAGTCVRGARLENCATCGPTPAEECEKEQAGEREKERQTQTVCGAGFN